MSTRIQVTPEHLDALSSEVGRGSTEIDATLARLRAHIEPIGGDWAGAAAAEFQSLWSQWQSAARDLNAALGGISALLRRAGDAYAQAEASIAATFRQ
ncbi:MAG TPA: WXG100 family type VII secretion target [Actinomycetes bacterium]|jgi:WXG100 family type VII secretion target